MWSSLLPPPEILTSSVAASTANAACAVVVVGLFAPSEDPQKDWKDRFEDIMDEAGGLFC